MLRRRARDAELDELGALARSDAMLTFDDLPAEDDSIRLAELAVEVAPVLPDEVFEALDLDDLPLGERRAVLQRVRDRIGAAA